MIDGCPACKVVYKLREGDIVHFRTVTHTGSGRPDAHSDPTGVDRYERFVVYWEFTCPACGIVQRLRERNLADRFKEHWPEEAEIPSPGNFYDWVEELGR